MKVLITRPRAQSESFANALRAAGFQPIFFPVIEIRPMKDNSQLDQALKNLNKYDWVVFTSVNAVEMVFDNHPALSGAIEKSKQGEGQGVKVATIGPKTAEALLACSVTPDFVPEEYVAESILPGLGDLKNKSVLLPRAEIARKALPEAISKAGGIAHEIVVYQTLPAEIDMDGWMALKSGVDVVTFTSASTVENFVVIARKNNLDPLNLPNNPIFACIGPITGQAAKEEGLVNLVVAKEYTTNGLIEAISKMEIL
ncbi:MAG: uroporphyrinogen-III synthase [Chloroflexi bacterium]|nr:uroporphyrinogen-III synthase [Chloroflexota bacterium]